MRRFAIFGVFLLVCLGGTAQGQSVEYEKYKLANGLTVILHEDHSLPMACVNMWYYVGGKDEVERRSGFAHLFEHLMFMGTRRAPGGDFDNIMEAGGGWNNASTSEDRTNYFSVGPSELLPTLLWLEADRLEDLGKEMTPEKLEKQRAVVRNERRQSYENAPYGESMLAVNALMFPKGHPYRIPVIGTHEDLEAATVEDVKKFFADYYVPSNASLVVAGDFDPAKIKPLIQSLFGTLPRGSDVVHASAKPVKLESVKRLTMTDTVQFARTTMVYHSPARFAPGDAEMDLVADVLTNGISSRLYQKLIYQDQLAVNVRAYQDSMSLGSLFNVVATAKPSVSLDAIENAIDAVVAKFIADGPSAEELRRQKEQFEYGAVSQLESLLAKADQLNGYQFFFDEPNSFKPDMDRYRGAIPDDLQRWAKEVLTPDARLILRVIPETKVAEINPRDTKPTLGKGGEFNPSEPNMMKLSNGVSVYHWHRPELPLTKVHLLLKGGAALDGSEKAGLASLTADMLTEGAKERNAMEYSDALDMLGASVNAWCSYENTNVYLSVLTRNIGPALDLFADAVLRPQFEQKEWDRVHRLHVEGLKQRLDRPGYVSRVVSMATYFGDRHPYSRPVGGTLKTAKSIALADVQQRHKQLYNPGRAAILVAGDISADEVKAKLELAFGGWSDSGEAISGDGAAYPKPASDALKVVVVDRPDAVQTVIQFTMPGPVYADPNRLKYELLSTVLGGTFTSRLNQNLREEHGYTYGARSRFSMGPKVGQFSASSSVRTDVTGAAIREFLKEFEGIRGGNVSKVESLKARKSKRQSLVDSFEGTSGVLSVGSRLLSLNRPFSDIGRDLQAIKDIDADDLNGLAYQAVPLEKGVLVLVGDKGEILKQIEGIDLPKPIEVTMENE